MNQYPCKSDRSPLKGEPLQTAFNDLEEGWKLIGEHHIEREYTFKNFRQALNFTNEIGKLAEEAEHHPDILLTWGMVKITLYTHKADGLTDKDFNLAAKCDASYISRTK